LRHLPSENLINYAGADYGVVVIDDGKLSGRWRALWLIKFNDTFQFRDAVEQSGRFAMGVTQLCGAFYIVVERVRIGRQIQRGNIYALFEKICLVSEDDGVRACIA